MNVKHFLVPNRPHPVTPPWHRPARGIALAASCSLVGLLTGVAPAADPVVPVPTGRPAKEEVAPPRARIRAFQELVAKEKSLWGYWPLGENLKSSNGAPDAKTGLGKPPVFRPGPLGGDSCLDLSNNAYLSLDPAAAMDSPELTVELVCKPKYTTSGTLFGLRNGGPARFSLHYSTESSNLKLWNGSVVTEFEADAPLRLDEWFHVALAFSDKEVTLWINGKRCTPSGATGVSSKVKGLPFLVGTTDLATGKSERGEILAAHLAIYQGKLDDAAIAAHVKALGWADKLAPRPHRTINEEIARIDSRIEKIQQDHGVKVLYKYSHDEFIPAVWHSVGKGTQLPYKYVPQVIDEIESFLNVVPPPVSRKELESILLFDDLKIGGGGMGAMAYGKSIYLCCVRPLVEIRYSLYHEFSHILQVAYPVEDEPWNSLLPKDYKYGQRANADPFAYDDKLRSDGFVINYSTNNRHEDIAVLSDYVFVRKNQTADMMQAYPALKRKVASLVKYYRAIHPDYPLGFYDPLIRDVDAPAVTKAKGVWK